MMVNSFVPTPNGIDFCADFEFYDGSLMIQKKYNLLFQDIEDFSLYVVDCMNSLDLKCTRNKEMLRFHRRGTCFTVAFSYIVTKLRTLTKLFVPFEQTSLLYEWKLA